MSIVAPVRNPIDTPGFPPLNAQTYPWDEVTRLINQAAYFDMFVAPEAVPSQGYIPDAFNLQGGFVVDNRSTLHRFESVVDPASLSSGLKVSQSVGEAIGQFCSRWMVAPMGFPWTPGKEPPSALFDPSVSQDFVMLDSAFTFTGIKDSFTGFGVGRTYPTTVNGEPRTLAGGAGNITGGTGKFSGLQGTYTLHGSMTTKHGFLGRVCARINDRQDSLRGNAPIPPIKPIKNPDPEATYIVLRGQKFGPEQLSHYHLSPEGMPNGLITPGELFSARYAFAAGGPGGLQSQVTIGKKIGKIDAIIFTQFGAPPGTAEHAGAFHTQNLYTFIDQSGQTVGTIRADVTIGPSFGMQFPEAPGQQGLRFGGYGVIVEGSGHFEGVRGTLTVNSEIGVAPHALSLMNTIRIIDPEGRFRNG